MWEAIRWFSRNGFKTFSFGRTEPENKGLLQYKNGWGTKQSVINYYKYDFVKEAFIVNHFAIPTLFSNLLKKIPIPILKFVGRILYKHMA